MGKINIGLVGYGYWGPNLARNFNANSRCTLRCIAEQDSAQAGGRPRDVPGGGNSPGRLGYA